MPRIGYLGPPGTFSEEALRLTRLPADAEPVPLATIFDTVMAVEDGRVDSAFVPIENSLEGSVDVTLDALATEARNVMIVGETVRPIHNCLIAASQLELERIEAVHSHPQPIAQCAHFLRSKLPRAQVVAANSTADAVRAVAEAGAETPWAALGARLAADLYDCVVLREGIEDEPGNETRFVWIARRAEAALAANDGRTMKTSIVFWGAGDEAPGWLVRCLSEFATREISLTRIESRPRRVGLGHYMFFADLEGGSADERVGEAIEGLEAHAAEVRVLGSYPTG